MIWWILSFIFLIIVIILINELVSFIQWSNACVQKYERIGKLNAKRKMDENDCKK